MNRTWKKIKGGWLSREGAGVITIHVKAEVRGDTVAVIGMSFESEDDINTMFLRSLPIAAIGMELNMPEVRAMIESRNVKVVEIPDLEGDSLPGIPLAVFDLLDARPPYGDEFYRNIADAYRSYANVSAPPATTIAKAMGANVGRVYGWIRESRRRKFLPPARQGKVG